MYDKYYGDEYFVRVLEKDVVPQTRWVEGSNFADVNFKIDTRTNRVVMMGAIDNMVKGGRSGGPEYEPDVRAAGEYGAEADSYFPLMVQAVGLKTSLKRMKEGKRKEI